MEDINHGPFRPDNLAAEVDFFSVHPYSIYTLDRFPDPMLSERGTYCGAFQTALSAGAGRPVMVHELGASAAQYSPERIAHFDRVTLYSSLAAGANGFLLWCYTDAAPETFNRVPYLRAPHETQFGLTTWDREDRPAGREVRAFSRILAQMDFNGVEPAPAEAALIVPHEWAKPHGDFARLGLNGPSVVPYVSVQDGGGAPDPCATCPGRDAGSDNVWLTGSLLAAFILARRAGLKVGLPREYTNWQTHPLLLLPAPLTSTERNLVHVHTSFWNQVRSYVQSGGTVYASLCADAAIPGLGDLFGATLADHAPVGEVTLTVVAPLGDLAPGEAFRYHAESTNPRHWPATLDLAGGRVIATDQENRPALVANTFGQGKALLSAYPLESYLAARPSAFEGQETTHRIYCALRTWAGLTPMFATDHPSTEVSALAGQGRGYAILANHRPEPQSITVTARDPLRSVALITAVARRSIPLDGCSWKIDLEGYGGAVVEWEA
jgi:hypothetical protein